MDQKEITVSIKLDDLNQVVQQKDHLTDTLDYVGCAAMELIGELESWIDIYGKGMEAEERVRLKNLWNDFLDRTSSIVKNGVMRKYRKAIREGKTYEDRLKLIDEFLKKEDAEEDGQKTSNTK